MSFPCILPSLLSEKCGSSKFGVTDDDFWETQKDEDDIAKQKWGGSRTVPPKYRLLWFSSDTTQQHAPLDLTKWDDEEFGTFFDPVAGNNKSVHLLNDQPGGFREDPILRIKLPAKVAM